MATLTNRMELNVADTISLAGELMRAARFEDAEQVLRSAVKAEPNDMNALHALAVSLIEQELPSKCEEAVALLTRAGIMCRDEMVAISCNMGKALAEVGRTAEAQNAFQSVLTSYPDHLIAKYGRGLMKMQRGKYSDAVTDFSSVLDRDSTNDKARFARGFCNLVLGNYLEGFQDYEHRLKDDLAPISSPLWDGTQDLVGKTILIHGEQGHGDDIMFLRYAPLLQQRGARVLVVLHPGIGPLVDPQSKITVLTEDRSTWPHFDYWIRMMSLAGAFGTAIETVPPPLKINLPPSIKNNRLRIGLCWAGGLKSRYDAHRSIPLAMFESLVNSIDADFISLQVGVRDRDRPALDRMGLTDFTPQDFGETAQVINKLDLVITCDTSVAHLAGSIGVPTLVLLTSFRTYWLWIQGLDRSPWYPSVKVLQQKSEGDWAEVIGRVRHNILLMTAKAA